MKATGIVRRLDDAGRLVIPKEIRVRYGWPPGTPMEFAADDDALVIRAYGDPCVACAQPTDDATRHPVGHAWLCAACWQAVRDA